MEKDLTEASFRADLIGEGKKYIIITFGCQANEFDTEVLAGKLESMGYCTASALEDADLILINTCAVRRKPEEKVAGMLGRLRKLKEKNDGLVIAVGGCMSQQPAVAADLARRFPFVNLIFGTHALPRFPQILAQARGAGRPLIDVAENGGSREGLPVRRSSGFHAWLPVIYGCNNYCSYCIVPHVRGRERSRPFKNIVAEARSLAAAGYKEITLLGQNVNSYGNDRKEGYDFADLLADGPD